MLLLLLLLLVLLPLLPLLSGASEYMGSLAHLLLGWVTSCDSCATPPSAPRSLRSKTRARHVQRPRPRQSQRSYWSKSVQLQRNRC